ncbi:hypothetical protein [Nocardioides sp. PD653]|uniref:hypothetical protein n=1 Tax=Nocardioides sp. PD653 TaxID=393303 RepID=UPI0009EFD3B4|nr:hypothetical protein [Nocardioides sp. PD653]GAW54779.1 uncharacterized protein (Precursor) [Nocardioides sp. PD653]
MSGQAPFVTSRRRQHELLRSWSTWALTSILLDPAEVARVRASGWSGTHHTDPDMGERIVGTADGLGFGVDGSWHSPRELIAWSEVAAIATAVPDDVRGELAAFGDRWRAHQKVYPRFTASAAAGGCGPIVEGQPLTPRQEAYVRELEAFEASGALQAWEQTRAELDAQRLGLHQRALATDANRGPVDLLELLEGQHLGLAGATESVQPARPAQNAEFTTRTGTQSEEKPMRIRNYTDHQRTALENLRLPAPFTLICERKTSHSSERVIFQYCEGDRHDSVTLDVDDRSRGYLDAGAAVLVARAHQRYQRQAHDSRYTESAREMSARAAGALNGWLDTHPSLEVKAWQTAQALRGRPGLLPMRPASPPQQPVASMAEPGGPAR